MVLLVRIGNSYPASPLGHSYRPRARAPGKSTTAEFGVTHEARVASIDDDPKVLGPLRCNRATECADLPVRFDALRHERDYSRGFTTSIIGGPRRRMVRRRS